MSVVNKIEVPMITESSGERSWHDIRAFYDTEEEMIEYLKFLHEEKIEYKINGIIMTYQKDFRRSMRQDAIDGLRYSARNNSTTMRLMVQSRMAQQGLISLAYRNS